jgi:hypothetical protein
MFARAADACVCMYVTLPGMEEQKGLGRVYQVLPTDPSTVVPGSTSAASGPAARRLLLMSRAARTDAVPYSVVYGSPGSISARVLLFCLFFSGSFFAACDIIQLVFGMHIDKLNSVLHTWS